MSIPKILIGIALAGTTGISGAYAIKKLLPPQNTGEEVTEEQKDESGNEAKGEEGPSDSEPTGSQQTTVGASS